MNLNQTQATLLLKAALDHNAGLIATSAMWLGKIFTKDDLEKFRKAIKEIDDRYCDMLMEIMTAYQEPEPTVPERPQPNPPSKIPKGL